MRARIYQPARTATQSGRANTRHWLLEFEPGAPKVLDPLTGWTGSADTSGQVLLKFATREEAVAYAERHAIAYEVEAPAVRRPRPKSYAANFRWNRVR